MDASSKVKEVKFYTKSDDPHNRQLVATMNNGDEHRFSEGTMRAELLVNPLPDPTLREIEDVAYAKAITFRQVEDDWKKVQILLCEFQIELDNLYD